MICIYTYPIHQPDIIISLNNVWIVINRTDSIYTFIQFAYDFIQPNSTTRSFPKKEKKPVSREEEKKTRNWQSLFWKKKKKEKKKEEKEAISREFRADKKKKKGKKNSETTPILSRLFLKPECNRETGRKKRRWRAKGGLKGWQRNRERGNEEGRTRRERLKRRRVVAGGREGRGRESESRFHYFISKAERCGDNGPPPEGWHDRKPRDISIVSNANSENETWNRWTGNKGQRDREKYCDPSPPLPLVSSSSSLRD